MSLAQATRESVRKLLVDRLGPVGPALRENEPMRAHTTLQIGGPADWFYEASHAEDVPRALAAAGEAELPVFVLGGGSNLLVSDQGFRGLVLHVACDQVRFDTDAAVATAASASKRTWPQATCSTRPRKPWSLTSRFEPPPSTNTGSSASAAAASARGTSSAWRAS